MLSTYYVVCFLKIIFHDSLQTLIPTAIPILHCTLLNNCLLPCRHITNLHSFICIFHTFSIPRHHKSSLAYLTLRRAADQVTRVVRGALQVTPHKGGNTGVLSSPAGAPTVTPPTATPYGDLTSAHQVAALPCNWPSVLAYHTLPPPGKCRPRHLLYRNYPPQHLWA